MAKNKGTRAQQNMEFVKNVMMGTLMGMCTITIRYAQKNLATSSQWQRLDIVIALLPVNVVITEGAEDQVERLKNRR